LVHALHLDPLRVVDHSVGDVERRREALVGRGGRMGGMGRARSTSRVGRLTLADAFLAQFGVNSFGVRFHRDQRRTAMSSKRYFACIMSLDGGDGCTTLDLISSHTL
jgi:hypothetical protein